MSNEEKFKETLNQKLSEERFEFDASNWAGAEALLDADKKGKRGLYYLIPFLLILTGFSTYLLWPVTNFNAIENLSENKFNLNTESIAKIKNTSINQMQVENKSTISSLPFKHPSPIVKPTESTEMNQPATINQNNMPLVTENISKSNTQQTNNQTNTIQNTNIGSNPIQNNLNSEKNENNPTIITSTVENKSSNQNETIETEKPLVTSPVNSVLPEAPITPSLESKTENTNTIANVSETFNIPTKEKNELAVTSMPSVSSTLLPDTNSNTNQINNEVISSTLAPSPTSFLFIELGTNYNLGWKNLGTKDANGFNPLFGVFFQSMIVKKFGFSFGMQYSSVGNLSFSSKTSKVTRYGLGEESSVTIITPSKLHYVFVPFKINYEYKEKNVFTLVYNLGYLLNVESQIETYNEHFTYNDNHKSYKTGGYTEGFGIFDSQIAAGYRRKLYKDFWLNAEVFVGVNDVKNNTFFESNVFERNKGLKMSLMYNVFKK